MAESHSLAPGQFVQVVRHESRKHVADQDLIANFFTFLPGPVRSTGARRVLELDLLALIWQGLDACVSRGADLAFIEFKAFQPTTFVANSLQRGQGTIGVIEFAQDRNDVAGLSGSAAKGKEQPATLFVVNRTGEKFRREVIGLSRQKWRPKRGDYYYQRKQNPHGRNVAQVVEKVECCWLKIERGERPGHLHMEA